METPADDVVIKSSNSDAANEEYQHDQNHHHHQQYQQQPAAQEVEEGEEYDDGQPARLLPLSPQDQLHAMARRREAAVCFRHQVEECRLALRYSVIGWTGTLDPVSNEAQVAALSPLSHSLTLRPPSLLRLTFLCPA